MAQIILPTREAAPQREVPKESALDKLLKGLQVANSAFGIATDISTLSSQSQAREMAKAREGREQAKFGIEALRTTQEAEGQAGGIPITLQRPGDAGEQYTSLRVPVAGMSLADRLKQEQIALTQARTQQALRPPAATTAQVRLMTEVRKKKEELEDDAKKHTSTIQKTGFPSIVSALNKADDAIAASLAKDNDIAGFGATGMSPQAALSKEGKDVRAAVESLKNQLLKARSGAAVTDSEAKRFLEEVGTNPFMTDEDLVRGLNLIRANMAENIATFELGLEPDALALLKEQAQGRTIAGKLTPSVFSDDAVFAQRNMNDFRADFNDNAVKTTQGTVVSNQSARDAAIEELKRRRAAAAAGGQQ